MYEFLLGISWLALKKPNTYKWKVSCDYRYSCNYQIAIINVKQLKSPPGGIWGLPKGVLMYGYEVDYEKGCILHHNGSKRTILKRHLGKIKNNDIGFSFS